MSGGTSSIQTSRGLQDDQRARRWATQLPKRLMWWKEILEKVLDNTWMSSKIWPTAKERSDFPQIALTIISESPSTKTLSKPSSFAKTKALRAAITSTVSTEVGRGIFCERAAKTNPAESRTTTPRPAKDWVENKAPSKLTFTKPGGGGFQRTERAVLGIFGCTGRSWLNSWTSERAWSGIFPRVGAATPSAALFLSIQIREMVLAKVSMQLGSLKAKCNKSMKEEWGEEASLSLANWGSQTKSIFWHDQSAWTVDSGARLQLGQVATKEDPSSHQVHFCWKGVAAGMPEESADPIRDMELPNLLPHISVPRLIRGARRHRLNTSPQQLVSRLDRVDTTTVHRPKQSIRGVHKTQRYSKNHFCLRGEENIIHKVRIPVVQLMIH